MNEHLNNESNADWKALEEKLNRAATAPAANDEASLNRPADISQGDDDSGAAQLRDAWLSFGRLLDGVGAGVDAGAPAKIAFPQDVATPLRTAVRSPRVASKRRQTIGRYATVVAVASILIAVVVRPFGKNENQRQVPGNVAKAIPKSSRSAVTNGHETNGAVAHSTKPNRNESVVAVAKPKTIAKPTADWDNPEDKQIDAEISAMQSDIVATRGQWNQQNDTATAVEYRLNEVEQDMSKGPL